MKKITVWENDMVDEIDPKVVNFINDCYGEFEVEQLSALSRRQPEDIIDSVCNSRYIIIQPNMLEVEQIRGIAQMISHPIHVNNCGNTREYDIRGFMFLSNHPWETLKEIKTALVDVKDSVNELCLMKILKHCRLEFKNFDDTISYELERVGYFDTKAVRYK